MDRRVLALFALVLVTFLAGCSGSGFGLTPDVTEVTTAADDSYQVTFEVSNDGDATFYDVEVYGYTLEGERVCSIQVGNLSQETATATTGCEAFPTLLVPNASGMERHGSGVRFGYVEHDVTLYRGYNGSHRFTAFTTREDAAPRGEANTTRLVDESVLAAGKCRQWADDGNYSIIGDKPWFDWEQQPPNTSTRRSVTVVNATNTSEAEEAYVYPESATTAATADAIEKHRRQNRSEASVRVDETAFDEAVSALGGRTENGTVGAGIDGSVRRFNGTGIDCWAVPPRYEGSVGYVITVFVRSDGDIWKVRLRMRTAYRGPARAVNGSAAA